MNKQKVESDEVAMSRRRENGTQTAFWRIAVMGRGSKNGGRRCRDINVTRLFLTYFM